MKNIPSVHGIINKSHSCHKLFLFSCLKHFCVNLLLFLIYLEHTPIVRKNVHTVIANSHQEVPSWNTYKHTSRRHHILAKYARSTSHAKPNSKNIFTNINQKTRIYATSVEIYSPQMFSSRNTACVILRFLCINVIFVKNHSKKESH